MRWLIEAADTKTGLDTEITVEAMTETEAEQLARYNGLLVSKVYKAARKQPAPVVPYAKPVVVEQGPLDFSVLVRRARSTRALGTALWVLGWAALVCSVGVFSYTASRHGWGDWSNWRGWLPLAAGGPAWRIALFAIAAITAGSVLRLLAAMALVLRIAARQGVRPRAERAGAADAGEAGAAGNAHPAQ